jgi:predicted GNAT superfamily acetyltransferase
MEIRKIVTPREYLQVEEAQRRIFGFPDREIVPLNELVPIQKIGGYVFGAFEGRKLVAFCFGCPGFKDGKAFHYSRMLGILPGCRDSGIGARMKLAQREFVLKQGLDLVTWTFDPLQSRNAHFNVEKLGVVIREYHVNLYAQSESRFNRGLDADRFTAEWWIRSKRVRDRAAGKRAVHDLDAWVPALEGPLPVRRAARGPRLRVEIPDDIDALKKADLRRARLWRSRTREVFVDLFGRGYGITGFASRCGPEGRRGFYLLEKGAR